jgi:hypothetical protein
MLFLQVCCHNLASRIMISVRVHENIPQSIDSQKRTNQKIGKGNSMRLPSVRPEAFSVTRWLPRCVWIGCSVCSQFHHPLPDHWSLPPCKHPKHNDQFKSIHFSGFAIDETELFSFMVHGQWIWSMVFYTFTPSNFSHDSGRPFR